MSGTCPECGHDLCACPERQTTVRVDCVTTDERTGVQREVHRRGQTPETSEPTDMICEAHPDKPWPHDDCIGPGMPTPEAIGKALAREAAELVRDDPAATEALYQAMQTASKELPDWADGETALDAKFKSVPVAPEASGEARCHLCDHPMPEVICDDCRSERAASAPPAAQEPRDDWVRAAAEIIHARAAECRSVGTLPGARIEAIIREHLPRGGQESEDSEL